MPLVTTGATIPGLYSHIAHSVDKDEAEIPPSFKGQNQSKPEVEVNLKENLKVKQNPPKDQEADKSLLMITQIIITIMIITLPQVKVKAADLLLVKVVANNLEASHNKTEAKDLSIIHVNSRTTGLREVHIRATAINTVVTANPTSRVINQIHTKVEAVAVVLNKQEDVVMVGPITTIITITSISITLMISRPNSMAHPVAYAEVLIIPLSIATKENMI